MQAKLTAPAPDQEPPTKAIKVKELAGALDVDPSTIYNAIRSGHLGAYRVGTGRGTIRIPRSALKAYMDERGIPAEELRMAL